MKTKLKLPLGVMPKEETLSSFFAPLQGLVKNSVMGVLELPDYEDWGETVCGYYYRLSRLPHVKEQCPTSADIDFTFRDDGTAELRLSNRAEAKVIRDGDWPTAAMALINWIIEASRQDAEEFRNRAADIEIGLTDMRAIRAELQLQAKKMG